MVFMYIAGWSSTVIDPAYSLALRLDTHYIIYEYHGLASQYIGRTTPPLSTRNTPSAGVDITSFVMHRSRSLWSLGWIGLSPGLDYPFCFFSLTSSDFRTTFPLFRWGLAFFFLMDTDVEIIHCMDWVVLAWNG